ncbi:regulatory protein GemA [Aeromonas sp. 2692-1]|uniref:gp16 family protein n=1 Tax=Aeromonas sp. 2692-1 TaxID=2560029 RepID=UPI00148B1BA5|nr:regulatory protein GemA [Aeromonas sp. 2692-1]QJT14979.1 regulatory protein GemA [Aeromonas sp. 2692-1]
MQPDAKRLLKLVQVGRRELGLDEEEYRALLEQVTGVRSAKGMSASKLDAVITAMKGLGFKVKGSDKVTGRRSPPSSAKVQAPEVRKLRAIWITMKQDGLLHDGSEDALGSFIRRMTASANGGVGISRAEWLTSAQAERVLEALKKWHIRLMKDAILARGESVPDTLSHRQDAMPGYDLIRDAYENPGQRPPRIMVIDGSKPVSEIHNKAP